MEKGLGYWSEDQNGLPKFDYTGVLPFQAADREGKPVKLPEDPWFLIGNYQLTLFTHVSGEYELIAGQRSWGRINAGEKANSGQNRATIWIDGKRHELCGMTSASAHSEMCSREFGCGYAKYGYQLEGIKVTRILAAQPSLTVSGGKSAFLIRVELTNTDTGNHHVRYEEGITAHYVEIQCQHIPERNRKIQYCYRSEQEDNENCGYVYIEGSAEDPLLCSTPDTESLYDGFPPCLYMEGLSENVKIRAAGRDLTAHGECELSPGESIRFSVLVGYRYLYENESVAETVSKHVKSDSHVVKSGETLSSIARQYHLQVKYLADLNGLNANGNVRIGQRLKIVGDVPTDKKAEDVKVAATPVASRATESYTVKSGESLNAIASRLGITVTELAELNNLSPRAGLRVSQTIQIPKLVTDYKVKRGDTLIGLASRYGMNSNQLAEMNDLKPNTQLRIGDVIKVPN